MNRRDFLKSIGLGGVALTTLKPLDILAAKMSDLEAPPLHVGYCEIGALADRQRAFTLHGITMHVEGRERGVLPQLDVVREFYDKWMLHLLIQNAESKEMIHWVRVPTVFIPDPVGEPVGRQFVSPKAYRFSPPEKVECWLAPIRWGAPLRYPLPKVHIGLNGPMAYTEKGNGRGCSRLYQMPFMFYNTFDHVRLDRAKAIKLGLASAEEPTFYNFAHPRRRAFRIDPKETFTTQIEVPFV